MKICIHSFNINAAPAHGAWKARTGTVALLSSILFSCSAASAQQHTSADPPYTLRASTTSSENLSEQTARAHGIARDSRRGVVNVIVMKTNSGVDTTVPASVHVTLQDLAGQKREVAMREVTANNYISYVGSYDFVRREVIDFTINATPEGSDKTLILTFRDRLWVQ